MKDTPGKLHPKTDAPVVDEKGRPLSGDGTTKGDKPVVRPSQEEQLPPQPDRSR